MKKIYFEPKMRITMPQLKSEFLIMSLDDQDPTNLPDNPPDKGGDGEEGEWGGIKERNAWEDGGLW